MHFYCTREELASNVSHVVKVISSKTLISVYSGVFIEVKGDSCTLSASNGQLTIKTSFKVDVKEEGIALIKGKFFSDTVKNAYSDEVEVISNNNNNTLTINCGATCFDSIPMMDISSYPEIFLGDMLWNFSVSSNIFKSAVTGTVFSAALENNLKQVLTGILIEKDGDKTNFVGVDGFRFGIRTIETEGGNGSFVVPARALDEISKTISDDATVNIEVYKKYIVVKCNCIVIISTLIDEKFIDYTGLIPSTYKTKIKINKDNFLKCINIGANLSNERKKNVIIFEIDDKYLMLSANNDNCNFNDKIEIYSEGEKVRVGFICGFILDCLRTIDDDEIIIEFSGDRNSCVIKPCENNNYTYIIMPMQI